VFKRLVIVVVGLVVVFGGIFGWKAYIGAKMGAMASTPPPPAVIAAAEVATETWVPYLTAVGSLVATQGVYVTNEVVGQVESIRFTSGGRVKKGDLLVTLDADVDRADLAGLEAERRLAEVQFERTSRLFKQDQAVPRSDLDAARARLENARAQVAARQALVAKKQIRAPFSGVLGIRQVNVGQYLPAGSEIVLLQALDQVYADFSLPERDLGRVATGLPVAVRVQPYGDEAFAGEITALDPGVDAATRNVRVRATLDNPDGRLRPGMFADVVVRLPEQRQVLTVPETAVLYQPYGDTVFVIREKDGGLVAERVPITTGEVRDGQVEVATGLEAGQRVVSAGHVKLRNGQAVQIDNSVTLDPTVTGP
jgi:membrane fusion protein (multidrug efflux system)